MFVVAMMVPRIAAGTLPLGGSSALIVTDKRSWRVVGLGIVLGAAPPAHLP
jgi:hypothetical protein